MSYGVPWLPMMMTVLCMDCALIELYMIVFDPYDDKCVCVIVCCSLPDETIDRKKEEEKEMKPLKKKYIFPG